MTDQQRQLRNEPAQTREQYDFIINLAREANVRLTRDLMQTRARFLAAKERTKALYDIVTDRNRKLTQARTDLTNACAARDALARECNQLKAGTVQKCAYCNYQATGADALSTIIEHIKSCPAHPLSKSLAELAQARAELQDLQGANRALARQVNDVTSSCDFWYKEAHDAEAELDATKERLATLDSAEQALQNERTLRQVAETGEQAARKALSQAIVAQADARLAAHAHELSIDLERQAVHTERQLRQKAEQRAERLHREYTGMHEALDECGIPRDYGDGSTAAGRTRVFWLNQRAEHIGAELNDGHGALTSAGVPRDKFGGKRLIASRAIELKQRAERAEALAQLVTKKAADLLERLANHTASHADSFADPNSSWTLLRRAEIRAARTLAAQIREAL